jgi:hypothetical protein
VTGATIAVAVGTFAFRYLSLSGFSNDHFDHVARGREVLLGAWPVRDFTDPGLPLMYLLSAAVQSLSTAPLLAEGILVATAFAVTAAVSLRLAARASGSFLLALAVVLLQVAIYPRSYSYPKLLVYALAIAAGWWAVERVTVRSVAVLAAVTALAYYFRHDHGVYVGLGFALLLAGTAAGAGWRHTATLLASYAALTLACVLPHLVYLQLHGGIVRYFATAASFSHAEALNTYISPPTFQLRSDQPLWLAADPPPPVNIRWRSDVDARRRAELEQRYRLRVLEHDGGTTWRYAVTDAGRRNVDALVADPHVDDTHGIERLSRYRWSSALVGWFQPGPGLNVDGNTVALLYWVFWIAPFAAAAVLVWRIRTRRDWIAANGPMLALIVAFAICANTGFIRDPLVARLPDVAVPQTIVGAWLLSVAWRAPRRWLPRVAARVALVAGVAVIAVAVGRVGNVADRLDQAQLLRGPGAIAERARTITAELRDDFSERQLPSRWAKMLVPFFVYVRECTRLDDRLLFAGYAPEVYFYAQRGFAGGQMMFLNDFHTSLEEQRLTVDRLERQSVPLIMVPVARRESFEREFSLVWNSLADKYVPVAEFGSEDGDRIRVLAEASRKPVRMYRGWPCFV